MKEQKTGNGLSIKTNIFYSIGQTGSSIVDMIPVTWLMFCYVPPTGIQRLPSAKIFGLTMILGRIVNSLADPIVSNWTDNCQSRLGRRIPFMLWGGLPLALSTVLLFFPPFGESGLLNSLYLGLTLMIFFFFFPFYVCPYLALLPDLASNDTERINITTLQAIFNLLGIILAMSVSGILVKTLGLSAMVVIMGALACLTFYAPVIGVRERRDKIVQKAEENKMLSSLMATLKNRPFVIYLIGYIFFMFGFYIVVGGVVYYVTVLIKRPEGDSAYYLGCAFATAILAFMPVNKAARLIGKRKLMIIMCGFFAVTLPMIYFLDNPPFLNPSGFGYLFMGLVGIPIAGLLIIPNAIVAELARYEEVVTGVRREAMFFGTQGFFLKVMLGLSTFVMGVLFDLFGKTTSQPLGVKLTGVVASVFAFMGMLIFMKYPENLDKSYGIKNESLKHKTGDGDIN